MAAQQKVSKTHQRAKKTNSYVLGMLKKIREACIILKVWTKICMKKLLFDKKKPNQQFEILSEKALLFLCMLQ